MATVRDGLSTALVLTGDAGIGKTRLLQYATAMAADMRVTWTSGAESEIQLGYAGLHQLLVPFIDRIDDLPVPQRSALAAAFGLVAGPPDRFLVGLAVLTLLADAVGEMPLVCVIDDAQWLDQESLAVLSFVARRLYADGVGLLFGVRDDPEALAALQGLTVHRLGGLPEAAALGLLSSVVDGRLDPVVAHRAVTETDGNPLALIELAGELSDEQLAGAGLLPDRLPLSGGMEAHFLRQVRAMPADTQFLLVLASAAPAAEPATFWRAAALLDLPPTAIDAAVSAGILLADRPDTFRHPLIRSAVHGGASPAQLRAVHAALGAVIVADHDPDRRAWHLAQAVIGLDDVVAADLDSAAERARGRGGYAAQAAFLSRSVELTSDAQARIGRGLRAAGAHLTVGDVAAASAHLDRVGPGLDTPVMRAAAQRLRAGIEMYSGRITTASAILLDAVADLGPQDAPMARSMLWDALVAGILARQYTRATTLDIIARTALATPVPETAEVDAVDIADVLLDAFATRIAVGYVQAVPRLRAAVAQLQTVELAEPGLPLMLVSAWAAQDLWDDAGFHAIFTRLDAFDRSHGVLHALNVTLFNAAAWSTWAGRFAAAEAHYAEASAIGTAIGLPPQGLEKRVELFAWQGREDDARAAADTLIRVWAEGHGHAVLEHHARYSLTILELSLGRYAEALACARPMYDDDAPGQGNNLLPNVIEAASRAGDRELALAVLARLTERATAAGTPWALGVLARGAALLAEDEDAERLYVESVDHLSRTSMATELARSHLVYGEWLRRRKRRTDARDQLRVAHDMFDAMGARTFAERARIELHATGEHARARGVPAAPTLTPQEAQVAMLAAAGATNGEIASRLFITASTVEYHLNKIFRKLAITSRRQLTGALAADARGIPNSD